MKSHNLKTIPPYFDHVKYGIKTFEFRKDDRGFEVGDVLVLKEYLPEEKKYTGRELEVMVAYKLSDFDGISDGYCVLGIWKP